MKFPKITVSTSLLFKIVGSFFLLAGFTVLIITISTNVRGRNALEESVFDRLSVASSLKEYQLVQWFDGQYLEVILLSELNDVRDQVNVILRLNRRPFDAELVSKLKQNPAYSSAYNRLDRTFKNIREIKPQIDQVSILNRGGYVLYSTDREKEGKYLSLGNTTTYFTKEERDLYKPTFYSAPNGKPSITFATPILNADKQVVAVVAVDLNLRDVDRLIRERTGLGKTGETYVVGSLETKVTFLARADENESPEKKPEKTDEFKDGVTSFAIEQVMQGKDSLIAIDADDPEGRGTDTSDIREARANRLYNNYRGVPVIGVFNWIDDLNLGLIAEMAQSEAFTPADRLARETLQLGLSAAGLLLVAVYLLSRRITQPILAIADTAVMVSKGQTSRKAPVVTNDEIGALANAFNKMTEEMAQSGERLAIYSRSLEREVAQSKEQLTAITSQMADGLIVVNPENRIVQCNRSLADLLQLVSEIDLVGCNISEAFTGTASSQLSSLVANAANNPDQVFSEQIIIAARTVSVVAMGVFMEGESPDESIYTGTVLLFHKA